MMTAIIDPIGQNNDIRLLQPINVIQITIYQELLMHSRLHRRLWQTRPTIAVDPQRLPTARERAAGSGKRQSPVNGATA
jgi:hypothetical protein